MTTIEYDEDRFNYKDIVVILYIQQKIGINSFNQIYEQIINSFIENNSDENRLEENLLKWRTKESQNIYEMLNDSNTLATLYPDLEHRPKKLTVDKVFKAIGQEYLIPMTEALLKHPNLLELKIKIKGEDENPKIIPQDFFSSLKINEPRKIFQKLKRLSLKIPTIETALCRYINSLFAECDGDKFKSFIGRR